MNKKSLLIIKILIDLVMLILYILVMGYHMFENVVHESIGVSIAVLTIIHTALNFKWYINIFKGKYSLSRVFKTIINLALLTSITITIISAMSISWSIFTFVQSTHVALGRTLHLVFTVWSFILMSMHLGLHATMLKNIIFKKTNKVFNIIAMVIFIALSIYGIYTFTIRQLYLPMLNLVEFVPLPYGESFIKYLFDHCAIVILNATIAYYINSLLIFITKKRLKGKTV